MNKKRLMVIYTILHFFVDFTTIFLIAGILLGPSIGIVNRGYVIITYNILAFAGQLPIGIVADALNKNRQMTALGCILACVSYPMAFFHPWTACVLASLGNGLFHVGAGADVLKMSMPKAGMSGLFVSSGALGVWLAYKVSGSWVVWTCPFIMLLFAILLLLKPYYVCENSSEVSLKKPRLVLFTAVLCFLLTIVIRSFLGSILNFPWKSVPLLSFLFVLAVMAGKAIGGFLGDYIGYVKTAIISLVISFVSFLFSFDFWFAGIIAVVCFNMTMPLTLTAVAQICGRKYGSAFGLTTFAIAIGFIPVVFGGANLFGIPFVTAMVMTSLVLMLFAYAVIKSKKSNG